MYQIQFRLKAEEEEIFTVLYLELNNPRRVDASLKRKFLL